jgi:hypothetical protein
VAGEVCEDSVVTGFDPGAGVVAGEDIRAIFDDAAEDEGADSGAINGVAGAMRAGDWAAGTEVRGTVAVGFPNTCGNGGRTENGDADALRREFGTEVFRVGDYGGLGGTVNAVIKVGAGS